MRINMRINMKGRLPATDIEIWLEQFMNKCVTRYNKNGSTIVHKYKEPGRVLGWLLRPFSKTAQRIIIGFLCSMIVIQFALFLG